MRHFANAYATSSDFEPTSQVDEKEDSGSPERPKGSWSSTMRRCTKLHHFRSYVTGKENTIHPIDTAAQPSDIFTKPLAEDLFVKHRKCLLGW